MLELAVTVVGIIGNGLVMVGVVRAEMRAMRRDIDKLDERVTFMERRPCIPS